MTEQSLEDLVGDWTYLPDVAARYGVPLSRVRRFVDEREVLTARVGPNRAVAVPTSFLGADGPRPELKGTFTVLGDGGMNDTEIIRWLHTVDPTLPAGDTPIAALAAGHKTEIRRRAQALAF
ncbi:MAG: Rv2175c family DNA-binding protein [Dermatophilaceae bacterium]